MMRARATLWLMVSMVFQACPDASEHAADDTADALLRDADDDARDDDGAADVDGDVGDDAEAEVAADVALDARPDSAEEFRDASGEVETAVAPRQEMRLHVLDVGQGEALIVEFPCGAMLVDTGGEVTDGAGPGQSFDSVAALEAQVRAFFAARPDLDHTFDVVVLSHPHIDHTRGVSRLLEMVQANELTVKNVVTNGYEGSASGSAGQRALHDFADATADVGRWYVLQRKTTPSGLQNDIIDPFAACTRDGATVDPTIRALWGRVDDGSPLWTQWDSNDLSNDNNHSVVLRIDFGDASLLLTGDLEEAGIAALVANFGAGGLLDVDLYKAGHHGSHNGTTAALVNAMSPSVAVISAGPAGREGDYTAWDYGHPRWRAVSDLLGDGDSVGVSAERAVAIDALVATDYANGHGVFETKHIAPAVFCTGWEGHAVVVTLRSDGAVELP